MFAQEALLLLYILSSRFSDACPTSYDNIVHIPVNTTKLHVVMGISSAPDGEGRHFPAVNRKHDVVKYRMTA